MENRLRFHRLFGCTLGSGVALTSHLGPGKPPADLVFTQGPPGAPLPDDAACVYRSPRQTSEGSAVSLFRAADCEILRFAGVADFHLLPGQIVAHPATADPSPLIEIHLLGTVFSYWLQKQGLVTLHASAVAIGGRAAAFCSTQGGGKTGLAAALLQAGHPLLSDDLLPVEEREGTFFGRPGYPQMRMWPDEATHFLGGFEDLPVVHPGLSKRRVPVGAGWGSFHDAPLPLAGLYLLERRPDGEPLEIHPLSPRDALIELLRHTFAPRLVQAAGFEPSRFERLARLVVQVPVRRLRYPSGFDQLSLGVAAVRRDLGDA